LQDLQFVHASISRSSSRGIEEFPKLSGSHIQLRPRQQVNQACRQRVEQSQCLCHDGCVSEKTLYFVAARPRILCPQ
jgi:hypothetical protein